MTNDLKLQMTITASDNKILNILDLVIISWYQKGNSKLKLNKDQEEDCCKLRETTEG